MKIVFNQQGLTHGCNSSPWTCLLVSNSVRNEDFRKDRNVLDKFAGFCGRPWDAVGCTIGVSDDDDDFITWCLNCSLKVVTPVSRGASPCSGTWSSFFYQGLFANLAKLSVLIAFISRSQAETLQLTVICSWPDCWKHGQKTPACRKEKSGKEIHTLPRGGTYECSTRRIKHPLRSCNCLRCTKEHEIRSCNEHCLWPLQQWLQM